MKKYMLIGFCIIILSACTKDTSQEQAQEALQNNDVQQAKALYQRMATSEEQARQLQLIEQLEQAEKYVQQQNIQELEQVITTLQQHQQAQLIEKSLHELTHQLEELKETAAQQTYEEQEQTKAENKEQQRAVVAYREQLTNLDIMIETGAIREATQEITALMQSIYQQLQTTLSTTNKERLQVEQENWEQQLEQEIKEVENSTNDEARYLLMKQRCYILLDWFSVK